MKRRFLSMDSECPEDGILVERNKEPLGMRLINPYAVGKRDRSDIIALAEDISKADSFIQATTCSKLQMIVEQMNFLKEQARRVLLEAKESHDLNHAACNFHRIPGNTYHLYERESGQKYFSMLSPEEWNCQRGPPHTYIGAYHLKEDMSWIPEEKVINRNVLPIMYEKAFNEIDVNEVNMDCK